MARISENFKINQFWYKIESILDHKNFKRSLQYNCHISQEVMQINYYSTIVKNSYSTDGGETTVDKRWAFIEILFNK